MSEHTSLTTILFVVVALCLTPVAGVAAPGQVSSVADSTAVGESATVGDTGHSSSVASVAGCSFPFSGTDATGTEVTVEQKPERVTTLLPSAAQTMWEIGGKEQIIGVSKYATYLDGAGDKQNVSSGGFGVSIEKVVGTNPDIVLAPNAVPNATVTKLRDSGLTVFKFDSAANIEDVRQKTTLIGKLTGNCEGATATNEWMMDNVKTAEEATADTEAPTVLYPVGGGFFVGSDTFISSMISTAGAENVLAEEISGYKKVSSEVIVSQQPDTVLFTAFTSYLASQSPYKDLTAVQNNQTATVDRNWMNQPAPRSVVFGVRNLTDAFHRDAYESADFPSRSEAVATSTPTPTPSPTEAVGDSPTATQSPTEVVDDTQTATESPAGTETQAATPGFGAILAVLAVAVSALLARRRN